PDAIPVSSPALPLPATTGRQLTLPTAVDPPYEPLRFFVRFTISLSLGQVSSATRSSTPVPDNTKVSDRATPGLALAKSFFEQPSRPETSSSWSAGRPRPATTRTLCLFELLLLHALAHHHRQIPSHRIHRRNQPLRRSIQQEQQLRIKLFLRWHGRQRFDLLDRNHAPFHHSRLEAEFRIILDILRQRLRQRHRVAFRVRDRRNALQILQRLFDLRALARALRQSILDHAILRSRRAQRLPQFEVPHHRQLGVGRDNHARSILQIATKFFHLRNFPSLRNRHVQTLSQSCGDGALPRPAGQSPAALPKLCP